MAIWLQTAEGTTKKYETVDVIGNSVGDFHYIDKYVTNCGLEWKNKPKHHEECAHLDCAIHLAEKGAESDYSFYIIFIMQIVIIAFVQYMGIDLKFALLCYGLVAFLILHSIIFTRIKRKQSEELTEYRDRGTINGFIAWKIDYQEEAKAKSWWQFKKNA